MLPEFASEAEFRDNWIRPFLSKLGYILVKNTHGPGEQGKDFFFGEFDKFGHLRISAVQAKLGNIGGGQLLGELLDQIDRCLSVKLSFHHGVHDRRVSSVYVMTNGMISDTARERIHNFCEQHPQGSNIYFLNGEQLDNQNRFMDFAEDRQKRKPLLSLIQELQTNSHRLIELKDTIKNTTDGEKILVPMLFTIAIEEAIRSSLLPRKETGLSYEIRAALDHIHTQRFFDSSTDLIELHLNVVDEILKRINDVMTNAKKQLDDLDRMYSLEFKQVVSE